MIIWDIFTSTCHFFFFFLLGLKLILLCIYCDKLSNCDHINSVTHIPVDTPNHTPNSMLISLLRPQVVHTHVPVMVSASLQSGGAGHVSSWVDSPSLTYCSSLVCRRSGSGSGSGSRSGAGAREGAGEASLAHLSLVERKRGHGLLELELHWVIRSSWQTGDSRYSSLERRTERWRQSETVTEPYISIRPINAPSSIPTESLTSSAAAESALCCGCLPASWINLSLSAADSTFHLLGNKQEGRWRVEGDSW